MNIHPRLKTFLTTAINNDASDVHLKPNTAPHIRIKGVLKPVGEKPLSEAENEAMIFSTLSSEQQAYLQKHNEMDYAIFLENKGRFRVNTYRAQGRWESVMRLLPPEIKNMAQLHLPPVNRKLALLNDGLVLVAGDTGSGKSTTLAAMIDVINTERAKNIITIENPVEAVHENKRSIISQREVGLDTDSFAQALRSVLRQDPDVILIGEIRDRDTAEAALQAAQTGHLVFATIHAGSSEEAVQRYLNLFPAEERESVRETLAVVTAGIVVQKLVLDTKRQRRPVQEVLVNTDRAARLIRDANHTEKYRHVIAEGAAHGMQTMEQVLVWMVQKKILDVNTALAAAPDTRTLRNELRKQNELPSAE